MSTTNILDLTNRIDELEKNSGGGGGSADSAKRSDIATEFNTTTAYTAGCFVYHEGKLYQFNTDHAAGAWDPTDVVAANVTDQIVSNKAAIDGLTASDVAYDNTDSGLTATNTQLAVDEIVEKMGNMSMTKLWENSDPTTNIDAGTLAVITNTYDFYLVIAKKFATTTRQKSYICVAGENELTTADTPTDVSKGTAEATRVLTFGSTAVLISDCNFRWTGGENVSNNYIIPTVIYGINLT